MKAPTPNKDTQHRSETAQEEFGGDLTITERVIGFVQDRWKIVVPVIGVLVIALIVMNVMNNSSARENEERVKALTESSSSASPGAVGPAGIDTLLLEQQESLREKYGEPKEGFIWDIDGTLLSLGDKSLSSDEVAYTFLRALNTLDFDTAESFSRRSSVVTTYRDFFDPTVSDSVDYRDQFNRNMYRQALLSLQVQNLTRSANFSDNKEVYTVTATMIDLSDKSFWEADRKVIFDQLKSFNTSEEDSTKADIYLFDYVNNYYQSQISMLSDPQKVDKVKLRSVSFDLTLQKYPAQDTGWLVSIDKDLDILSRYSDGVSVIDFIKGQYQNFIQG